MKPLNECSTAELREIRTDAGKKLEAYKATGLSLNMARGKPSPEQLDFSDGLLNIDREKMGVKTEDGFDCRNYGLLCGIPECRRLFAEIFGVDYENVIACGSSSLNLMYDYISQCMVSGVAGCEPWLVQKNCKFIAIVPGYDRHFAIAQHFGLEMISIPMTQNGPDMDMVEEVIKDPKVKGMFCVPKYSNPDGVTYSDETVERLAKMKPAAKDFRVIWDEAYVVHDLYPEHDELANIFKTAEKYGNENNFIAFASTSKITFSGAGVAALAASDYNIKEISDRLTLQIISYDKVNQLRHSYFFKDINDVYRQMEKHAELLRPKFDTVLKGLECELGGLGIAQWTKPKGGYFISLDVLVGSAKLVGKLCSESGLVLTKVGATYPYGIDPLDRNIRIAPSYPSVDELKIATDILCAALKISAVTELENKSLGR